MGNTIKRWEWPGGVTALIVALIGLVQFFQPNISIIAKVSVFAGAAIFGLYLSFKWKRKYPFVLAAIAVVAGAGIWTLTTKPTFAQEYVQKYLSETRSANIWYGNVVMNADAENYMLNHFSAYDPRSIAYPYTLPGARPMELETLVQETSRGNVGDPIITLGQVSAVSKIGLEPGSLADPEYVVQLLPITPSLRQVWQPRRFGEDQITNSTGELSELYPTTARDQINDHIDIYVRIHPRPFPIPHSGDGMVVRGYVIAYGRVATANGHLFDTLYLAGSSATVYPRK